MPSVSTGRNAVTRTAGLLFLIFVSLDAYGLKHCFCSAFPRSNTSKVSFLKIHESGALKKVHGKCEKFVAKLFEAHLRYNDISLLLLLVVVIGQAGR